jgi:hypothetical protein
MLRAWSESEESRGGIDFGGSEEASEEEAEEEEEILAC